MAAGLGFKTFTTGEVLTAADTNGYLMQGINVFANSAARAAAITSPQEGQYSYLKDTNALEYYDGAAWVGAPVGDITAVTAGKGLTGGGSSGDVTVSLATTAKGDLVVGSGASTAAVLTVGNNGETLVADSSTSTGLRYTAGNPIPNPVINSCFDVWQRGTSIAVGAGGGGTYTADRWLGYRASTGTTVSRQATSDTTNLPNIQYCARVQRTAGDTSTNTIQINNPFESVNSIPLAGKTITVSFYARKGANFSEASSNLTLYGTSGTGTDQSPISGLTGASTFLGVTATLTTTWQRFSSTATMSASATQLNLQVFYTPTGTAGAADYFEITGVQVDVSSVALPVRRNGATIQGELAACQRYYYKVTNGANNAPLGNAFYYANASLNAYFQFPVTMRTSPTIDQITGTNYYQFIRAGGTDTFNSFTLDQVSTSGIAVYNATEAAGTAGQAGYLFSNSTSASLAFTSEL